MGWACDMTEKDHRQSSSFCSGRHRDRYIVIWRTKVSRMCALCWQRVPATSLDVRTAEGAEGLSEP